MKWLLKVESEHLQMLQLMSQSCSRDEPDFVPSLEFLVLFRNREISHSLPVWEEQRAVPVKGLKHSQPKTSRCPLYEENSRVGEKLCVTLGWGRPHQRTASECQVPKQSGATTRLKTPNKQQLSDQVNIDTRDATNCEVFHCLPVLLIRAVQNEIGGDTRPIRGGCSRLSPPLTEVLTNTLPSKKTLTSSLCALLCGHRGQSLVSSRCLVALTINKANETSRPLTSASRREAVLALQRACLVLARQLA